MTTELDFGQPPISAQEEYWRGQAVKLAGTCKADMVVVSKGNDNYQPWHKSIADKCGVGYDYVAKYSAGATDSSITSDKDGVK